MDSKDFNVEKSSDHQSITEDVIQDGSTTESIPSVPETKAEQVHVNQSSLSRTSSLTKQEKKEFHEKIEDETVGNLEETLETKTNNSTNMISTATSSGLSSSTTSIPEVKQMTKRQLATVITLCFVNLLKYMDRFTIAGKIYSINSYLGAN